MTPVTILVDNALFVILKKVSLWKVSFAVNQKMSQLSSLDNADIIFPLFSLLLIKKSWTNKESRGNFVCNSSSFFNRYPVIILFSNWKLFNKHTLDLNSYFESLTEKNLKDPSLNSFSLGIYSPFLVKECSEP